MSILRTVDAGAAPPLRAVSHFDEIGYDTDAVIERLVEGIPAGRYITAAVLTVKTSIDDTDAQAVFQSTGVIDDTGAGDLVGKLTFPISRAQSLLVAEEKWYDIQVTLDNSEPYTLEGTGRLQAARGPVFPQGVPIPRLTLRPKLYDPVPGARRRFPREFLRDMQQGTPYVYEREIDGLAGATVTEVVFSIRATPYAAGAVLAKTITSALTSSGQITDTGAAGVAKFRILLTGPEVANLAATAQPFDVRATLSTGKVLAVGIGTTLVQRQVTGTAGTGGAGGTDMAILASNLGDNGTGDKLRGLYDWRHNKRYDANGVVAAVEDARNTATTGRFLSSRSSTTGASVASDILSGASAVTMACWFVPYGATSDWGSYFGSWGAGGGSLAFDSWDGDNVRIGLLSGQQIYASFSMSANGMTRGRPLKVFIVFDGSLSGNANRLKLYVAKYNYLTHTWGASTQITLSFTGTVPATLTAVSGQSLSLGWEASGGQGQVALYDDFRIYTSALSQASVDAETLTSSTAQHRWQFAGNGNNTGLTGGLNMTMGAGVVYVGDEYTFGPPIVAPVASARPSEANSQFDADGATTRMTTGNSEAFRFFTDATVFAIGNSDSATQVTNGYLVGLASADTVPGSVGVMAISLGQNATYIAGLAGNTAPASDFVASDVAKDTSSPPVMRLCAARYDDAGSGVHQIRVSGGAGWIAQTTAGPHADTDVALTLFDYWGWNGSPQVPNGRARAVGFFAGYLSDPQWVTLREWAGTYHSAVGS